MSVKEQSIQVECDGCGACIDVKDETVIPTKWTRTVTCNNSYGDGSTVQDFCYDCFILMQIIATTPRCE